MTSHESKQFEELRGPRHKVVAYRSDWARKIGPHAALWLCQAMYMQLQNGAGRWWYKLILAQRGADSQILAPAHMLEHSFEYETSLSRSQQESARATLRGLGILQEKYARVPRRLEYMIDLDRLSNLSREWSTNTERNSKLSEGQENADQRVEFSALGREPQRASKQSIQITEKSREENARRSNRSQRYHPVHRDATNGDKKNAEPELEAGVRCLNNGDHERVKALVGRYGEQEVAAAAKYLENMGETPFPSRVHKVLGRRNSPNPVEVTSALLRQINEGDKNWEMRAAAREIAQQLPAETREKFLNIFAIECTQGITSSLDRATGKFANIAERIQFERWMESKIITSHGALS